MSIPFTNCSLLMKLNCTLLKYLEFEMLNGLICSDVSIYVYICLKGEEIMYQQTSYLQLCAGLKHMHSSDPPYAHNDVKPGNVLLTYRKGQSPLATLMDFGSARPARKQIRTRSEALQLQVLFI